MLVNLYCSHKIYDQSHVVIGFFLPEFGVLFLFYFLLSSKTKQIELSINPN
ncbi:hypothetical protein VCHA54O485_210003 [Vibrio chagasii]|nr:hypothetical protein VCHA55P509_220073 [Vibrio chagasii]CAH7112397.1 hypothetical protein VCHA54O485_210003 [Vibrio chagasii]CAH7341802.1 hypothetical protein VCHA54P501_220003 [Vibrio chagasii]CAH7410309.1 hypothetical protein VCHA49P381_70151 [Vibrio chagasii]